MLEITLEYINTKTNESSFEIFLGEFVSRLKADESCVYKFQRIDGKFIYIDPNEIVKIQPSPANAE